MEHRLILEDSVMPVCSPNYPSTFGPFEKFETKAEVLQTRLIRSPLEPWTPWSGSCGLDVPEPTLDGQFNDTGLMCEAAASDFGVALLRKKLGAAWLDSAWRLRLPPSAVPSPRRHDI